MDKKINLEDYKTWLEANGPGFSKVDYIHGIINTQKLSSDLYFAFLELFWPEFVERDGMVLIKGSLDQKQNVLSDNSRKADEKEYWINLLSIDGLLGFEVEIESLFALSTKIGEMWETKLKNEYPTKKFRVHVINHQDDVAVTFQQAS